MKKKGAIAGIMSTLIVVLMILGVGSVILSSVSEEYNNLPPSSTHSENITSAIGTIESLMVDGSLFPIIILLTVVVIALGVVGATISSVGNFFGGLDNGSYDEEKDDEEEDDEFSAISRGELHVINKEEIKELEDKVEVDPKKFEKRGKFD